MLRAVFCGARERASMREHDAIIKIECLPVKSMDEREKARVASGLVALFSTLESVNGRINIDDVELVPYNLRYSDRIAEFKFDGTVRVLGAGAGRGVDDARRKGRENP